MAEAAPLDFYFDLISPYGYFASLRIDALAARHRRTARWRPMLLGVSVLKAMGLPPIARTPLKGPYHTRWAAPRYARLHAVRLARPLDAEPMDPLPAARLFCWLDRRDPDLAKAFAAAAYRRYWGEGGNLDQVDTLAAVAAPLGVPSAAVAEALDDPAARGALREAVAASLERGVFGCPFFFVDDEPFFGADSLEMMEQWLQAGGWQDFRPGSPLPEWHRGDHRHDGSS